MIVLEVIQYLQNNKLVLNESSEVVEEKIGKIIRTIYSRQELYSEYSIRLKLNCYELCGLFEIKTCKNLCRVYKHTNVTFKPDAYEFL